LTAGSEYLKKQIRSLENRIRINGGKTYLIVYQATHFRRVTVNIHISKKELPVLQVVSLLDQRKSSLMITLRRGSIYTEILELIGNK